MSVGFIPVLSLLSFFCFIIFCRLCRCLFLSIYLSGYEFLFLSVCYLFSLFDASVPFYHCFISISFPFVYDLFCSLLFHIILFSLFLSCTIFFLSSLLHSLHLPAFHRYFLYHLFTFYWYFLSCLLGTFLLCLYFSSFLFILSLTCFLVFLVCSFSVK